MRPECVYATKSGMIYASHADPNGQGGVTCIYPDGRIEVVVANKGDVPETFITNGYALLPDGDFMIANLGSDGGVFRLSRDGTLKLQCTVTRQPEHTPVRTEVCDHEIPVRQ